MAPDREVGRALVIVAHPDDAEFWAGGTIATWSEAGVVSTYLVLTDGDAGGVDETVPRAEVPGVRRAEQRSAAKFLGVSDVRFLGRSEGSLVQSSGLRRELVRVIRHVRPQRLLTWSPEWNWSNFRTSCHIDHRMTGELALASTYPEAGNPFAYPELLSDEGLDPWHVPEIWLLNSPTPNHYVDVTEKFDRKMAALRAHVSQTGHRQHLEREVRNKLAPHTLAAGLPAHRAVEGFQVVLTL